MNSPGVAIDLFVFYTRISDTVKHLKDGADGVVIDWEAKEKCARQTLYDTQINMHSLRDLSDIRASTTKTILCRVNQVSELDDWEIEESISHGADELLLPMVQSAKELSLIHISEPTRPY